MRRIVAPVTIMVVVLIAWAAFARGTNIAAQDDPGMAGHPLVGSWMLDTDTADPDNPPTLAVFSADGVYLQHDYDGIDGVGSWEATGDSTAAMTFHTQFPDDEGEYGGSTVVRASIEVMANGDSLTATYTLEFRNTDRTSSGELGPGEVTGSRIQVQPMGTPVASFEEAFAEDEPAATP